LIVQNYKEKYDGRWPTPATDELTEEEELERQKMISLWERAGGGGDIKNDLLCYTFQRKLTREDYSLNLFLKNLDKMPYEEYTDPEMNFRVGFPLLVQMTSLPTNRW